MTSNVYSPLEFWNICTVVMNFTELYSNAQQSAVDKIRRKDSKCHLNYDLYDFRNCGRLNWNLILELNIVDSKIMGITSEIYGGKGFFFKYNHE